MEDSSYRSMTSRVLPGPDLDQITVVRIDDTHIKDGGSASSASEYYEMEYSLPGAEEEVSHGYALDLAAEEEENNDDDDSVYVIEYSNPEEEGESYQFTMSVDRSLPPKKPTAVNQTPVAKAPMATKPSTRPRQQDKKKIIPEAKALSNKSVLELGEGYSDIKAGIERLVCMMCPPPRRVFKAAAGLAVHMKLVHKLEAKKTFFCSFCETKVRTQVEFDVHTRRHANQTAVFTCHLCPGDAAKAGFNGSRNGLKKHLETEHPGIVPSCKVCNKNFKFLTSYLADQFRHVGVSPFHCPKCQIYEMTERGLIVHLRNCEKKRQVNVVSNAVTREKGGLQLLASYASPDNSATDDDSDF